MSTAAERFFVPAPFRPAPAVAPATAAAPAMTLRPAPLPPSRFAAPSAERGSLVSAVAGDVQSPPAAEEERWTTRASFVVGFLALLMGIARTNASGEVSKDVPLQDNIPNDVLLRRYNMYPGREALDEESLKRSALALLAVGGQEDDERFRTVRVLVDKVLCIAGFIFPVVELCASLAGKVLLTTDDPRMRRLYSRYLAKIGMFYLQNVYACFAVMLIIFLTCSRGRKGLSKFLRFNVIQAVLMSIVIQCFSVCWPVVPFTIRESWLGVTIQSSFFWGAIISILYAIFCILLGRYPKFPVISDAAKLQVMRGYD